MRTRRVGGGEILSVDGQKRPVLLLRQPAENGAQRRALHPFQDRVPAVKQVVVNRFPHLDPEAGPPQSLGVPVRRLHKMALLMSFRYRVVITIPFRVEPSSPRVLANQLVQQPVSRVVEVARHLNGQYAVWGKQAEEVGKDAGVVGHPLQSGVRDNAIKLALGLPGGQVGLNEMQPGLGRELAGLFQHVGGIVNAVDRGLRPARTQGPGQRAGTAAQVGRRVDLVVARDAADEVEKGPRAFAAEALVLLGDPSGSCLRLYTVGLASTLFSTLRLTHRPSRSLPTSLPSSTMTLPRSMVSTG